MKTQMTQIGIGLAALSALAVEGKDFNREELNAMLDKLAASPEPKSATVMMATCYVRAMPRPAGFEYVCKKCGNHTVYLENTRQMANVLARRRDEAASLSSMAFSSSRLKSFPSAASADSAARPIPICDIFDFMVVFP